MRFDRKPNHFLVAALVSYVLGKAIYVFVDSDTLSPFIAVAFGFISLFLTVAFYVLLVSAVYSLAEPYFEQQRINKNPAKSQLSLQITAAIVWIPLAVIFLILLFNFPQALILYSREEMQIGVTWETFTNVTGVSIETLWFAVCIGFRWNDLIKDNK